MNTPTRSLTPEQAEVQRQRDEWWKRIKAVGGPATNTMIEELAALDPDHAQEHWDRWNSFDALGKDEVRALIAELRKPKLPKSEGVAERTNRQSTEELWKRHQEEVREAVDNQRILGGRLAVNGDRSLSANAAARAALDAAADNPAEVERVKAEFERDRFQSIVDHWGNARQFAAEAERKLREDLDPCNLGLYGIHGTLYGRERGR